MPTAYNNFSECQACLEGYYRTATMKLCEPCPEGTYEDGTKTGCLPCPAGQYNDQRAQSNCTVCDGGTISAVGSNICQSCNHLYINTYSSPNRTVCLPCPDGKSLSTRTNRLASIWAPLGLGAISPSRTFLGAWRVPSPGWFASLYNLNFTQLPGFTNYISNASADGAGFWDPISQDGCQRCPNNTFRAGNETVCTVPPEGYYIRKVAVKVDKNYTAVSDNITALNDAIYNTTSFIPLGSNATGPLDRRRHLRSLGRRRLEELYITPLIEKLHRRLAGTDGTSGDLVYEPYALYECPLGFFSVMRGGQQCAPCPQGTYADQVSE